MLKNGDRIAADSVKQYNGRVEYWVGNNSLTIPQSIVARIEAGPAPATSAPPPATPSFEVPTGDVTLEGAEQLMARVIHNGAVDVSAIQAIEHEGSPAQSAVANAIAAGFEERRHNLVAAARYLESALRFLPRHSVLLEDYASVLIQLGRPAEALSAAQRSVSASPESAEAWKVLGYAYYKNDHNREAIAALKKCLQLRPDDGRAREMLEQLERESQTEAQFRQQDSSHFTLRYEGSRTADALRSQILETLEAEYNHLQIDLGGSPRNVFVSLYTDQEFFDVTQAPAWSAALNDGKIRVPISGVKSITPGLAAVLRHELTHSFIQQIAHGRAPTWLNEGVAQLEQGFNTAPFGPRLAALYASGNQVPLNQLEGNFTSYSPAEAAVVYAESLAAAEYIRSAYGMPDLARILQRVGEGQSIESALRSTIHGGYAELEKEIAVYLKKNYGT